jgi:hypothetical protein
MQAQTGWINSCWFETFFWIFAVAMSFFHGSQAVKIFSVEAPRHSTVWNIHQFWFNLCGSLSGWVALWFLLQKISVSLMAPATTSAQWSDVGLFFLAFIGVTGYLPFAVITGVTSFKEIASKVIGK